MTLSDELEGNRSRGCGISWLTVLGYGDLFGVLAGMWACCLIQCSNSGRAGIRDPTASRASFKKVVFCEAFRFRLLQPRIWGLEFF